MPESLKACAHWHTQSLRLEPVEIAGGAPSSTGRHRGGSLSMLVSRESFRIQGLEKKGFARPSGAEEAQRVER